MLKAEESELDVRVVRKRREATDICSFELAEVGGRSLPPFAAGSHIDVHMRGDLIRQYSLCNPPWERDRYVIAVLRDAQSRGGSVSMHDDVQQGDVLRISTPKNFFPLLDESTTSSLLFAGGIGITPLLCMAEQLQVQGRPFALHYCTRERDRTAFYERIDRTFAERAAFHFDAGPPEQRLDIAAVLEQAQQGAHLYVCGPSGFMEWLIGAAKSAGWPDARIHREYFKGAQDFDGEADRPFRIKIASTGQVLMVASGETVIDVLSNHGIDLPKSCEQGICGTCLTRVLDGEPDHRDMFLTEREHAKNDCFTPCCSRARSDLLVLDL